MGNDDSKKWIKDPDLGYSDVFSKREMWEEIAKEQKGELIIKLTSGKVIEIHNLIIPYKNFRIEISASDSRPLKFQLNFQTYQDFEMIISWEDVIERILKKFGKAETEMGWEEFDKHYIIKTNNSGLLREILTRKIQQTLLKYNVYSLSYLTDKKKNTATLLIVIERNIGDKAMILELIEMFKELVDNLIKSNLIK